MYKKILFILLGGNLLAQLVNAIFIPISTRLYSLEAFNELAIFIAILLVISTISGLRFDVAILKSKDKTESIAFFYLSLLFALIFSLLTGFIIVIIDILGLIGNRKYFYLLSPFIFLVVLYNSCINLANVQKEFVQISKSRVSQAISSNFILLVWGLGVQNGFGLFLSYCMTYSMGVFSLYPKLEKISFFTLKKTFYENLDYPKYSVVEALSDVGGYQLPIAFIGIFSHNYLAGLLFMGIKIMNIPISILARALSNIYTVRIRDEKNNFSFLNNILKVSGLAILVLSLLVIIFYKLETFILGENWLGIHVVLLVILPWMIMQFISTVFNPVFYIYSQLKFISKIQVYFFLLRFFGIIVAIAFYMDELLYIFTVLNFICYTIWVLAIYHVFKLKVTENV